MKRSGFTLIEVLVVLFIVSIMSGIVVANMPSFARTGDFDTEAKRIKVLLEMAREEAVIQGREYGFKPEDEGYRFYAYNELERHWERVESRPFHHHKLSDDVKVNLSVEGEDFRMAANDEGDDDGPPLLIFSSGEITPFELTIRSGRDSSRTLVSDGFSELDWQGAANGKDGGGG